MVAEVERAEVRSGELYRGSGRALVYLLWIKRSVEVCFSSFNLQRCSLRRYASLSCTRCTRFRAIQYVKGGFYWLLSQVRIY